MRAPLISVIVPAFGPAEGLEGCLQALRDQSRQPHEVLVVDNGLDGGPDRITNAHPTARVIRVQRRGSYAARNGGLLEATGEVLAFTDSDCEPSSEWLQEAWRRMSASGSSVLAGEVQVTASPWGERQPAELLELKFGFPQKSYVQSQGFGVTANLVVRREVFERVGLFDETLLSGGDFEWGRRATSLGYRAVFEAAALVRHPARRSYQGLLRKQNRVSEGICFLARTGRFDPEGFLRLVLWTLSPPIVAMAKVLADASLGPMRVRIAAMDLLIRLRVNRFRSLAAGMLREGGA
jgi:GT2 family glycosyltransferase